MRRHEPRIDELVRHADHIRWSRAGEDEEGAPSRQDRDALVVGGAMFLLPTLWLLGRLDFGAVPVVTFLLVTLAYGAASTVEFEVGAASAVPTEPLLMVMLLLLPPGIVPVAVFVGLGIGSAWIRAQGERSEPLLATACSSVHAVGPALVVEALGLGERSAGSVHMWAVVIAAVAAQVVGDFASSGVRNCVGLGVAVSELRAMLWWSLRVDLLLAPIGLAAALAFPSGPMAVAVAVTPLLLIGMLAVDRRRHIDGLLRLTDAFSDASARARRDQLTGLGNRLAWDERIDELERYPRDVGVVMLDVDWLKTVNDDYGHEAGDRLLKAVAGVLDTVSPEGATVCRLGGDEFGVLLGDGDAADAEQLAGFIRAAIAACAPVYDTTVSASIGTSAVRPGQGTVQDAIDAADRDIYRHKAARGRSRSRPRVSRAPQVLTSETPMGESGG